jgi:TPR repeat protein
LYETGRGVDKDVNEALKWYRKAATLGRLDAKKKVKELEEKK